MSRTIRLLAALVAAASLAAPGTALAAKITGGTTTISVSSVVASTLAANHLTVTALTPASSSGSTFTFPISNGRLNLTTLRGFVAHTGGLAISNGTVTFRLRRPTIVSTKRGAFLYALVRPRSLGRCLPVRRHLGRRCRRLLGAHTKRIARLTDLAVSGSTGTATVNLTAYSARVINRLAGKTIAQAGTAIGTASLTPTIG